MSIRKHTTETILKVIKEKRQDKGEFYNYSKVDYVPGSKILIICPIHGEFLQRPRDHISNSGCKVCGKLQTKQTNLKKYGVENPLQNAIIKEKIKKTCLKNYGVENPSKSPIIHAKKTASMIKRYGASYGYVESIKEKCRQTSIKKYGVPYAMQTKEFKDRMMATKMKNGSFTKSNSSNESTVFIRNYIKENGYDIFQVCYADLENNLHEWGYHYKGRWRLFDLVVFEKGYRGNINHILEILEFHGLFHYSFEDSVVRADNKAYPWKTNKTTIKESYQTDCIKKEFAELHSEKFTIIKPLKYRI